MNEIKDGVAVVLLNYRGAGDTLACLDSLLAHGQLFDRLFICDNASPDDSWSRLKDGLAQREASMATARRQAGLPERRLWSDTTRDVLAAGSADPESWIVLIDNQANLGFAAGNNVALRVALQDRSVGFFWLLNNDTELPTSTLQCLLAAALMRPEVDLWGATVVYHDQPDVVQALGGGSMNARTAETRHIGAFRRTETLRGDADQVRAVEAEMDYALGASMLVTRRWLDRVGLMAEDYFLYYEELDWALRGKRAGLQLGYAPDAVVWHKEGASIGTAPGGGSPLSVFHLNRSRAIFVRKFFGLSVIWFSTLRSLWQIAKYILKGRLALALAATRGVTSVWRI